MPSLQAAALQVSGWNPYCGVAPIPADLAGRWNFDPWLIAALGLASGAYVLHRRRGGAGQDWAIAAAAVALTVAFVSPLCALASALFSARVVHHALLVVLAAPLLVFGLPMHHRVRPGLAVGTAVHAVALWTWHAPGPYGWALTHDLAYWLMQVTLLGSAFLFWTSLRRAASLSAAAALVATLVHTGLLGALITLAGAPLFAPHLATTLAFGLTPLEDQQLAGLIMWAPMAGAYLLAALILVGRSLEPSGRVAGRAA